MAKKIVTVILSGIIALQVLGGCTAPYAGTGHTPQEAAAGIEQMATPMNEAVKAESLTETVQAVIPTETPKPSPTPTAASEPTMEQTQPTATPETDSDKAQEPESGGQKNEAEPPPQKQAPEAAEPTPDPTPAPTAKPTPVPTPAPTPEPTEPPQTGGAKCHTCGTIIPDSELVAHMKYHALHDGGGGYDTD